MSDDDLDVVDEAILYHLQVDARTSITNIADALDVSDNTIRNRIQRMEDDGVIEGYHVDVDYDRAGVQHHYLFVCSVRVSERERLAEAVGELSGVVEVLTVMTGTYNLYVVAVAQGKDEITDLAREIDELGVTIDREHLIREHVRQPNSGFQPPDYMTED